MTFKFRRHYHGGIQAVLLDWAGTTMDYGCMAPAVVFVEVFKRQGVPITMEEARAPMGAHKRVHIQRITELDAGARRWQEKHGRPPDEADVERDVRGVRAAAARVPVGLLRADPGHARGGRGDAQRAATRSARPPATDAR